MSGGAGQTKASRVSHLRAQLARPPFLAIAGGTVAGAAAFGALTIGPAAAAVAGLAALAIVLAFAWLVTATRAEREFYDAYAADRSLRTGDGVSEVPPVTSLLRRGVVRYSQRAMAGRLSEDFEGLIAMYTYERHGGGAGGDEAVYEHHFTVVLTEIPEAKGLIGHLACQRRAGFRFLDSAEDAFRDRSRVAVESVDVDRRYEIFIGSGDDQNVARQLLSPTFLEDLSGAPDGFAFELEEGMLAANMPGHLDTASAIDAMCAATASVRRRISSEALESHPAGDAPAARFDPGSFVAEDDESGISSRMARRTGALAGLLALPVLLAIVLAIDSGGGSGGGGGDGARDDSGSTVPAFSRAEIEAQDARMLGFIARRDDGQGVSREELGRIGVPPDLATAWAADAVTRGLILVEPGGAFRFRLSADGQRELDRSKR